MPSEASQIIFYPEFRIPLQFRQCAACYKTEFETGLPTLAHANATCQKNDWPSHKEPCIERRNARRRHELDSPEAKWEPLSRAGGEGADLVQYDDLQKDFITWTQTNVHNLARAHYHGTKMRRSIGLGDGYLKCLSVKLTGHRNSSSDSINFEVADVDTVMGIDLLRRFGAFEGPFADVRAKQRTRVGGVYVFAVLLGCGPIIHFMPIGAHEDLLSTWGNDPEWKSVFKTDVIP